MAISWWKNYPQDSYKLPLPQQTQELLYTNIDIQKESEKKKKKLKHIYTILLDATSYKRI